MVALEEINKDSSGNETIGEKLIQNETADPIYESDDSFIDGDVDDVSADELFVAADYTKRNVAPFIPGEKIDEKSQEKDEESEVESESEGKDEIKILEKKLMKNKGENEDVNLPTDLTQLKTRIQNTLDILANFKNKNIAKLPRKEYIERLCDDMTSFYGYSRELVDAFLKIFSPEECREFLNANESPRPVCIRSNPLLIKRRELARILIGKGVNLDPIGEWTELGLKITESRVPLGATPEYLSGYYMLQSASSMVPVIALDPKVNEQIADLCAAPGGKTTHIGSLMKNTGILIANDINIARSKALIGNIHRMGLTNTIVTAYNAKELGEHFSKMDRVLLDAPCTGMGVISRDESIKSKKTLQDVWSCSHLQKEIILKAIDMLKVGGVLVYSTCSIMIQENEVLYEVVNYAKEKRNIKIVPLGVDFGVKGFTKFGPKRFHSHLKHSRRFYPHVHNMDGFFVAKIIKTQEFKPKKDEQAKLNLNKDMEDDIESAIQRGNVKNDLSNEKVKKKALLGKRKRCSK